MSVNEIHSEYISVCESLSSGEVERKVIVDLLNTAKATPGVNPNVVKDLERFLAGWTVAVDLAVELYKECYAIVSVASEELTSRFTRREKLDSLFKRGEVLIRGTVITNASLMNLLNLMIELVACVKELLSSHEAADSLYRLPRRLEDQLSNLEAMVLIDLNSDYSVNLDQGYSA